MDGFQNMDEIQMCLHPYWNVKFCNALEHSYEHFWCEICNVDVILPMTVERKTILMRNGGPS